MARGLRGIPFPVRSRRLGIHAIEAIGVPDHVLKLGGERTFRGTEERGCERFRVAKPGRSFEVKVKSDSQPEGDDRRCGKKTDLES